MFTDDWKKSNVLPIHNRDSKNLIKHYGPINLLPFFSKVFERLVFDSLLNYVIQNKQFNDCQSGFIHGKYFESIWQGLAQSFILELKSYGVDGGLLKLMVKHLTGCQKWLF